MGNKLTDLILICVTCCMGLPAQQVTLNGLAGLVADGNTRRQAMSFVSDSRRERIPLLIEMTTGSFPGVNNHNLQVGLAEIFGDLKVEESIPFLVSHLIMRRYEGVDFASWSKTDDGILGTFPCIQALVSIGPPASKAIINEYAARDGSEGRLAAIFVVARVPGVPEAVEFLKGVSNPTFLERYYIKQGLELQTR